MFPVGSLARPTCSPDAPLPPLFPSGILRTGMADSKECAVLYVDDEAPNLVVFDATFGDDFPVLCASSADEALAVLDRRDVGVLLTDQRMPGMSGIDLCERVRETHPNVVRILVTALPDQQTAIEAINRGGIHRFVSKPWDRFELKQVLGEYLARVKLERAVHTLRNTVAEREQLVAMSVLRARVLHDLANVTTALMLTSSSISHDLARARRHLPPDLSERMEDELGELRAALRYLVQLHDKTRSIVNRPNPEAHRALELVSAALELVSKDVCRTLRVVVDGPEEAMVWADKTDISRILVNLILNSREAIERAGRQNGEVRIRVTVEGDGVQILVSDDGPGVPEQLRPGLFEPDWPGRLPGVGLGLPISRQIAHANHGDIVLVDDGPLPGATFRLVLPSPPAALGHPV